MDEQVQDKKISGMSIAPRLKDTLSDKEYWYVDDWIKLEQDNFKDWETAIKIFNDRIHFRYLGPIEDLILKDERIFREFRHRRYGFSIMALNCLLIETLAQFYDGLKESPSRTNQIFYTDFLNQKSLVLKAIFTDRSAAYIFFKTIRCGILHQAETKENSIIRYSKLNDIDCPFELLADNMSIIIYRKPFQKYLNEEFNTYKQTLQNKSDATLVENFKLKMGYICRTK